MNFIFIFFVTLCVLCESRRFTRCKLALELSKYKCVDKTFLGNWVCLIEKVSNRDTSTYRVTPSGKKKYGLYQIPSSWCREGKRGGDCNLTCESLLDDDIRDDTACAINIFHQHGFKYWPQWNVRCKNDILITKEIYKCPDLTSPRSSPERYMSSRYLRYKRRSPRSIMQATKLSNIYRQLYKDEGCLEDNTTQTLNGYPESTGILTSEVGRSEALTLHGTYIIMPLASTLSILHSYNLLHKNLGFFIIKGLVFLFY